jgi:hypothetical protein
VVVTWTEAPRFEFTAAERSTHPLNLPTTPVESPATLMLKVTAVCATPAALYGVTFKLYAPGKTLIECEVHKGKISKLEITPRSRGRDLIIPPNFRK